MNAPKTWLAENTNPDRARNHARRRARGHRRLHRPVGPGRHLGGRREDDEPRAVRLRDGEPGPEVAPEECAPFVKLMATGRSDYPNQINNVLAFPGHLPRRARRARAEDHRGDEAGRGARDRRGRLRRRARRGLHRPERLQPRRQRGRRERRRREGVAASHAGAQSRRRSEAGRRHRAAPADRPATSSTRCAPAAARGDRPVAQRRPGDRPLGRSDRREPAAARGAGRPRRCHPPRWARTSPSAGRPRRSSESASRASSGRGTSSRRSRACAEAERPGALVSMSAIGCYGARGDEPVDESEPAGDDFLAGRGELGGRGTQGARSSACAWRIAAHGRRPHRGRRRAREDAAAVQAGRRRPGRRREPVRAVGAPRRRRRRAALPASTAGGGTYNVTAPEPVTNRSSRRRSAASLHRPAVARFPPWPSRRSTARWRWIVTTRRARRAEAPARGGLLVPAARPRGRPPGGGRLNARAAALLGALTIAFSAILVKASDVAPPTSAFFRCFYAVPVLWLLARGARAHRPPAAARLRGRRPLRHRPGLLALLDRVHRRWAGHRARQPAGRPGRPDGVARPVRAARAARDHRDPARADRNRADLGRVRGRRVWQRPDKGAIYGVITAISYTGFILLIRQSGTGSAPAAPLFEATWVAAIGCAIAGIAIGDIDFVPSWPEHGWLVLLALSSQVAWMAADHELAAAPARIRHVRAAHAPAAHLAGARNHSARRGPHRPADAGRRASSSPAC